MQVVDSSGNVFGQGLEITDKNGKPKVPIINTDITIGTTAIVGGVVGRVLFQGAGNVVQESSSFTYDDTLKKFTLTGPIGSVIQHTALTNYNGLSGFQLNVADGTERAFFKLNPSTGEIRIGGTGSGYFPTFYAQGVEAMRIFASTRNVGINTTTDAGYKADINGTLRVQGAISIFNPAFTNGGTIAHTANSTLYITGGPGAGGENITFGPSNRIFINAQQTRFPNGSVQMSSTLTVGSGNATSTNMLLMQGSITAASALGRGIGMDTTLVASANNDVLVGLDVKPTYTNGAFTGLTNVDLRTSGANVTIGSSYGYGALYGYANDGIVQIKTAATYKTQMWFRPSGNAGGYNANYWSRIEHDMGTLNIIGSSYGQLSIASAGGNANGARIYFSGSTGIANNALSLEGPGNSGRIALTTYGSSPVTINGGNLLVNTLTDAGFKLDVNGTARVSGNLYIGPSPNGTYMYSNGYDLTMTTRASDRAIWLKQGNSNLVMMLMADGNAGVNNNNALTVWTTANTNANTVASFCVNGISGNTLIGTSTDIASSILTVNSTTKGFLPPRMTTTQKNAIASPAAGLVIFDTTLNKLCVYTTAWETITSI